MTCCFISKFHECNSGVIIKMCKEESQEYYTQEANKLMDEIMELICPSNFRWGEEDCTRITAELPEIEFPDDEPPMLLPLVLDMMKKFTE